MATEHLHMLTIGNIRESGKMGSLKVLEYLLGLTEIDMKGSTLMDLNMERGRSFLPMVKYLKENGKMAKSMVKANLNLEIRSLEDYGKMVSYKMPLKTD